MLQNSKIQDNMSYNMSMSIRIYQLHSWDAAAESYVDEMLSSIARTPCISL